MFFEELTFYVFLFYYRCLRFSGEIVFNAQLAAIAVGSCIGIYSSGLLKSLTFVMTYKVSGVGNLKSTALESCEFLLVALSLLVLSIISLL